MSEIKYQGIIDLSVKNNSHTMAYEYVDKFADGKLINVLEVGCSSGYFGSALKAAGHTVWGIEPNKASADVARDKLDYVFVGLVEDFIQAYPDKKFDLISFGDVLEHIAYPNEVLSQCHNLLVDGGAVVASVPNVGHIAVRAMLLEGGWQYSELGILDKTHLRFFTRETLEELFNESQYALVDIKAVTLPAEMTANMCKMPFNQRAIDAVEAFATDSAKYDFQYVVLAVPAFVKNGRGYQLLQEKPKTRVLALALNVEQSHFNVRLGEPLRAWAAKYYGDLRSLTFQECDENSIIWADVVVIQRHLDVKVMNIVTKAASLGKKIVFEIDDLLIDLPEFLSHHKAGLVAYLPTLEQVLPQVNSITVTTRRLQKQLERFNRPISVIPNCATAGGLAPIDQRSWRNGVATLIVASTDAVLVDFILPAISQISRRTDLEVKVLVIGPPGDAFDKVGLKCERVPNFTYHEFKKFIRTIQNPIGLIPLDDSIFSSCKSPIKYFDYSLAGIPVICSNVPPYSDVIKNGFTGLLVENTTEAWFSNIEALVQSVETRQMLVAQSKSLVESEFNLDISAKNWQSVINRAMSDIWKAPTPSTTIQMQQQITKSKFVLTHLISPASYKAALRVLKRDGVKGVISRIFPPPL